MKKEKSHINYREIAGKVFFILTLLLTFVFIVAKNFVPLLIGLMIICWLAESSFSQKWENLKKNNSILYFIPLYFLYLAGLSYSDNTVYGWLDIVLKLPILIFPLLFFSSETVKNKNFTRHILTVFIVGNFIVTLASLCHSAYLYSDTRDLYEFYYIKLGYFIHPSYYAMHLNFCIIALLWMLTNNIIVPGKFRVSAVFLIFYFSLFIVFLSSKLGMFFLGLIFIYLVFYFFRQKKYFISVALVLLALVSVLFLLRNFSGIKYRIISAREVVDNYKNIDKASNDGTAERIMIWKASVEIISDHLLFGVGTGDVKDVLMEKYKSSGINGAYEKRLNAHDQYLQTFIALGLPGFLLILLMFAYGIYFSVKKRELLYFSFLLLVIINLLVESMFETQAGVAFYTFFNSILFLEASKAKQNS
jgi:O-antigen ligase